MSGVKGKSGRIDHSTGEKAGRKIKGDLPRDKKLFGYRYTEEEYDSMIQIIEKLKEEGLSTSDIILKAILNLKNTL